MVFGLEAAEVQLALVVLNPGSLNSSCLRDATEVRPQRDQSCVPERTSGKVGAMSALAPKCDHLAGDDIDRATSDGKV